MRNIPQCQNSTYLCSLEVAALPLSCSAILSHGDLDLLQLGLGVLQLHLQVLCQLGSFHRLEQGRNWTHSIKNNNDEIPAP